MVTKKKTDVGGFQDWSSWSLYIIKTLESLQERADDLEEEVGSINLELRTELMRFKVYSRVIAAISGFITAIIVSVIVSFISYYITIDAKKTNNNSNIEIQTKK